MPRVLRIINRLNLGGPTFNVAYLTKYLEPEFETMLVAGSTDETEASSRFILDKVGVNELHIPEMQRSINPIKDRIAYKKIKELILDFKPDIVHTHAAKAGALGRLAASNANVPVILHTFHGHVFHSYFNPIKTTVFLNIERMLAKRSSRIIAISERQKTELTEHHRVCPAEKVEVVPLGFDLSRFTERQDELRRDFRQRFGLSDDMVAVALVGRLVPVKNHLFFLDCWKEVLQQTKKSVRAFIVGDGELMETLQQGARDLGIPFTVGNPTTEDKPLVFTSWIREVEEVMAGCDLIALTSLNEGTPVSLIEAQAAGKPIVSTRVGGIADVVKEGESALLAEPGDIKGFTNHLIHLIEDGELRGNMANTGKQFVLDRFSYQRLVGEMGALYHRLLHEHSATVDR